MTLAANNKLRQIEARLDALESALQILLRSEHSVPVPEVDLEQLPVIQQIKNEIRGIKMRAGRWPDKE
jgi:hypothetical protein